MALGRNDIVAPFIQVDEDENGCLQHIAFVNDETFNLDRKSTRLNSSHE